MSRYGISIRPTMMKLGSTTPAYHGSKNTSISCKPRKYHGAFDGLGVRVGFDGCSSGALSSSDHTVSTMMTSSAIRNSLRTRNGQVGSFSSTPLPAFLIGTSIRLPPAPGGVRDAPPAPAAAAQPTRTLDIARATCRSAPTERAQFPGAKTTKIRLPFLSLDPGLERP